MPRTPELLRRAGRWCRTPAGVLATGLLVTLVVAFGINLAFDQAHAGGGSLHPVFGEFGLYLLGAFVIWLVVVLVVSVVGRLWLGVGIVLVIAGLVGFADYRKYQLLGEPLFPSDLVFLGSPQFLADMVGPGAIAGAVVAVVVMVALAVLAGRVLGGWFPRPMSTRARRTLLGGRVVAALASATLLFQLGGFHEPGNWMKSAYDGSGAYWRPIKQNLNYADNGFVAGMLFNLPMPGMPTPPDYSAERMRALVEHYRAEAERINRTRDPDGLRGTNVVFVLSEAFSDPSRSPAATLAEDPIPYTRSLMRRTTSGSMWAPEYGRGTANTEFETLTGLSLAQFRPQMNTPFQMLLPSYDAFPSAARFLAGRGLGTLALHSFTSELYRRAEAYPVLGFDEAVFQDGMSHTDRLEHSPYISDEATFTEVTERIEESRRPLFANVVTMQNHYPMAGHYDHPIDATGLDDADATAQLEHYARGLRYTDQALERLIDHLEASKERTVLVFYGDHLPILWPQSELGERTQHQTPFFVYANFGRARAERLPTTSPIYFMNQALRRADAPVSPFHALLEQLEQEIPAMGRGVMIGPDDRRLSMADLSPRARRLLHDYRLVQYDLAVGQGFAKDSLYDVPGPPRSVPAAAR